jgi:hypothetical protein
MRMKIFTKAASVFAGFMGLIHLYRIIFPFRVSIGNFEVPVFGSIIFLIIAFIMCIGLWRESRLQ